MLHSTLQIYSKYTLQNGLFTTAAIDNIDHNPSSTTAADAFHSTSISIFQHPEEELPEQGLIFDVGVDQKNVAVELPESYTTIFPAKTVPSEYPLQQVCPQEPPRNDETRFFTVDETSGCKMFTVSIKPWRQIYLMWTKESHGQHFMQDGNSHL